MNNPILVARTNTAIEMIGATNMLCSLMEYMSSRDMEQFLEYIEQEHNIDTNN